MSELGLLLDERFERHLTGPAHPERPERLRAIRRALQARGLLERCRLVEPQEAPDAWLGLVHDAAYVRHVEQVCARGPAYLDSMDTVVGRESARVARLAAGGVVRLAQAVVEGSLHRAVALVRPPGHHAERDRAMGFCLFNNVAVAAAWLRAHGGIGRVLIVDWDVHHGNGTQHIFEEEPEVFYFSVHQFPLYPGTGTAEERGRGRGLGATRNCPLPPGAGDEAYLGALRGPLGEEAERFRPEFVLVSAGFDPHRLDPLAQLKVSTEAFGEATRIVREIAETYAGGRLVSVLEGGYHLEALSECVALHVETLLA